MAGNMMWLRGLFGNSEVPVGPDDFSGAQYAEAGEDPGWNPERGKRLYEQMVANTKSAASPESWKQAVDSGYITPEGKGLHVPGFAGGDLPKGTNWVEAGSGGAEGDIFHDPIYGDLQKQTKPENEWYFKYGPALALGPGMLGAALAGGGLAAAAGGLEGAAGGELAGAAGGELAGGLGSGAAGEMSGGYLIGPGMAETGAAGGTMSPLQTFLANYGPSNSTLLKQAGNTGLKLATGERNPGKLIGSALGGLSGIPGMSTLGGIGGSMLTPNDTPQHGGSGATPDFSGGAYDGVGGDTSPEATTSPFKSMAAPQTLPEDAPDPGTVAHDYFTIPSIQGIQGIGVAPTKQEMLAQILKQRQESQGYGA